MKNISLQLEPHKAEHCALVDSIFSSSLSTLKMRIIKGEDPVHSFGTKKELEAHAEMLRQEFVGQSELLLYHALLNVLLRRRIAVQINVQRMRELWEFEADFLLQHLDSRWLVSACDTIIDHFPEPEERSLALAGSLLINIIKLYETERLAINVTNHSDIELKNNDWNGRQELFNGVSAFVIGRGNMVYNLHQRIKTLAATSSIAGRILQELLQRANNYNTVFKRFKDVHVNNSTAW